jgi:NADH:ubiquinone oxidoreductase subunit
LESLPTSTERRRTFEGDEDSPLPAEWLSWLRFTREPAPTEEETQRLAMARDQLAARVAVLRREEALRKQRRSMLGDADGEAVGNERLS